MKEEKELSRHIPDPIARQVRKECGFGCIICGNPIYEYDHIDPEFNEATEHNASAIGLLCPTHHSYKTRKVWSKEKFKKARLNPFALQNPPSPYPFDIENESEYVVKIGGTSFSNMESIIEIDDRSILSIRKPEDATAPFRISAIFFDRANKLIGIIEDNQWFGSLEAFDIEVIGQTLKVRSQLNSIDLQIRTDAPNCLIIEKLNLAYNDKRVMGEIGKGFKFFSGISQVDLIDEKKSIKRAQFWVRIKGRGIYIGTDNIVKFTNLKGEEEFLSGYYYLDSGTLKITEEGNRTEVRKTDFIAFSSKDGGGIELNFDLPESEDIPYHFINPGRLRNEECDCGSGIKFKKCCWASRKKLIQFLNDRNVKKIISKLDSLGTHFVFRFNSSLKTPIKINVKDVIDISIQTNYQFSLYDIASHLAFSLKIKEGFPLVEGLFYDDTRQKIIYSLYYSIMQISVREYMRLCSFSLDTNDCIFLETLKTDLLKNKGLQDTDGDQHLGAVMYVQFNYFTFTLNFFKRKEIDELFDKNAPKCKVLGKILVTLINKNNPYTPNGVILALKDCASFLNQTFRDSPYSKFVDYLDRIPVE